MMRNKFLNIFLIFFGLFLYSCQTASEALQGKKRSDQSDEFLVEKKNPLKLPPDFDVLPIPKEENTINKSRKDNEIKELLTKNGDESKKIEDKKDDSTKSLEETLLDKIKKTNVD